MQDLENEVGRVNRMAQPAQNLEVSSIPIASIRTDGGTQMRASIDSKHVIALAEDYGQGVRIDPIVVYYDGTNYWLADGFHRLRAKLQLGDKAIDAEVRSGDCRQAILFACGVNDHKTALKRSNQDKRRAVMALLRDEEWSKKSSKWIAETCRVSHTFVDAVKEDLATEKEHETLHVPPDEPIERKDGVSQAARGTSKAPGAARKRVVEAAVEYESAEPTQPENEVSEPPNDPVPFDSELPVPLSREYPVVPLEPKTELEPVSGGAPEHESVLGQLDRLREHRESLQSYRDNRDNDRRLRENLGLRSEALELIDFVLRGGECALVRFGLDYSSSLEDLKSSYRREGLRCHPDRGGTQAQMASLNAQYSLVKSYFEARL